MKRVLVPAVLSLMISPAALACGMYMPDHALLVDVFEEIDSLDEAVVEGLELVGPENTEVIAEVDLAEAAMTASGDALASADIAVAVQDTPQRSRRAKRQRRKAKR